MDEEQLEERNSPRRVHGWNTRRGSSGSISCLGIVNLGSKLKD